VRDHKEDKEDAGNGPPQGSSEIAEEKYSMRFEEQEQNNIKITAKSEQ